MKRYLTLTLVGIIIAIVGAVALCQVPAAILRSNVVIGGTHAQAAGSFVLVESHTASSSAELDFTTCISSAYDDYQIDFVDILPASTGQHVFLQVSTNGGSSYDTGNNYQWGSAYTLGFAASGGSEAGPSVAGVQIGTGNLDSSSTWGGMSGSVHFYGPTSAGYKHFTGQSVGKDTNDAGLDGRAFAGMYLAGTSVNAFRVIMSGSVNLASGTVRCYGIAH